MMVPRPCFGLEVMSVCCSVINHSVPAHASAETRRLKTEPASASGFQLSPPKISSYAFTSRTRVRMGSLS